MNYDTSFTEAERDEIAHILESVAQDGLPGPRDLDVALDAIEATLSNTIAAAKTVRLICVVFGFFAGFVSAGFCIAGYVSTH